jgi:hypothetical protein
MDVLFLHHTIAATLDQKGHSVQLLFAFEYIILASTAAATLLKYLLSMLDAAMEGRWEGKGTYVFYLELLKDMMHLFVYCIFFVIVFSNYGLPLHLVSWRKCPGGALVGQVGWGGVAAEGHDALVCVLHLFCLCVQQLRPSVAPGELIIGSLRGALRGRLGGCGQFSKDAKHMFCTCQFQ